jgi:hypothetical protein
MIMRCATCQDFNFHQADKRNGTHSVPRSALCKSADEGCTSCHFLRSGVEAVLGLSDYDQVEINRTVIGKNGEERHIYPLPVYVAVSPENRVQLDFYTDHRGFPSLTGNLWKLKKVQRKYTRNGPSFPLHRTYLLTPRLKSVCRERGIG